jgi:hypothetical protein
MSCAIMLCHSPKSKTIGVLPFAGQPGWLAEHTSHLQAAKKPKVKGQRGTVPKALADSEHSDPEHVWGDEGPVTD